MIGTRLGALPEQAWCDSPWTRHSTEMRNNVTYCQKTSARVAGVGNESMLSGMLGSKQRALR